MMTGLAALLAVLALRLLYVGRGYAAWTLPGTIALVWWWLESGPDAADAISAGTGLPTSMFAVVVVSILLAVVTGLPAIRRQVVSRAAMGLMRPMLPRISETEREALDAGTAYGAIKRPRLV